ncbi:MAG: hypothetical protein AABY22_15520 [Nanoarchaeota archaeon]
MILEQETFEKYGYKLEEVKTTKHPIIIKCDYCNSITEIECRKITRSKNPKHNCSRAECHSQKSSESMRVLNKNLGIYPEIGDKFGRLMVLGEVEYGKRNNILSQYNSAFVECKCECGKIEKIRCVGLKNGRTKNCGKKCPIRKYGKENINFKGHEKIYASKWIQIQNNAKSGNRKFEITIQQIWDLFLKQNRKCALSGLYLEIANGSKNNAASIDRIDSSKGYTPDNIQWVHKRVNIMKNVATQEEFIEWCRKITKANI